MIADSVGICNFKLWFSDRRHFAANQARCQFSLQWGFDFRSDYIYDIDYSVGIMMARL